MTTDNRISPYPKPEQGKFLVLEGGEGVGKSTQMQSIAQYLYKENIPCVLTREPGGTPLAEQLRAVIVREEMDSLEELLLILAARRNHIRTVIRPALQSGLWVLCDRFSASTWVYQGILGGLDLSVIQQWHVAAGCEITPDYTFILHMDPETALCRRTSNRLVSNKFDEKDMDFHLRIQKAYRHICQSNPDRYACISADAPVSEVTKNILLHIQNMILSFKDKQKV